MFSVGKHDPTHLLQSSAGDRWWRYPHIVHDHRLVRFDFALKGTLADWGSIGYRHIGELACHAYQRDR